MTKKYTSFINQKIGFAVNKDICLSCLQCDQTKEAKYSTDEAVIQNEEGFKLVAPSTTAHMDHLACLYEEEQVIVFRTKQ